MTSTITSTPVAFVRAAVLVIGLFLLAACSSGVDSPQACADEGQVLNFGFFAFFPPVSYSADEDPASAGFNTHSGYEADLLTALEAMEDTGLSFSRRGIAPWPGIWLRSADPEYDVVGGGITSLDSRTRNDAGETVVTFTLGHITFRQSLLVRVDDAEHLASHDDLTQDVLVAVVPGTTGESRLLELTGLANASGVLIAGARVETPQGMVVADGSTDYAITAAGESPNLEGRTHLHPPVESMPQVVYLGDEAGDAEILEALKLGKVDAFARGEIGNLDAARASGGSFVVTALDTKVEHGAFTLALKDEELASCIDERLRWLTDDLRIVYPQWRDDPSVFMRRAEMWNDRAR